MQNLDDQNIPPPELLLPTFDEYYEAEQLARDDSFTEDRTCDESLSNCVDLSPEESQGKASHPIQLIPVSEHSQGYVVGKIVSP